MLRCCQMKPRSLNSPKPSSLLCVTEPDLNSILVWSASFSNFRINVSHAVQPNVLLNNKLHLRKFTEPYAKNVHFKHYLKVLNKTRWCFRLKKREIFLKLYGHKWNLTSDFKVERATIKLVLIRHFTAIVPCVVFLSLNDMHLKRVNLKIKQNCSLLWGIHLYKADVKRLVFQT